MHLRNLVCLISFLFCFAASFHARSEISGPITLESPELGSTEVLSWSWGAARPLDIYSVGGASPRTSFAGITISRHSDEYTANLLSLVATGNRMQSAVILRDGMTITLEDVLVTSYSVTGASSKREPQAETIDLNFARIRFEIGGQSWSWDIAANK